MRLRWGQQMWSSDDTSRSTLSQLLAASVQNAAQARTVERLSVIKKEVILLFTLNLERSDDTLVLSVCSMLRLVTTGLG